MAEGRPRAQRRLTNYEAELALQKRVTATVRNPRPAQPAPPVPPPTPLRRRIPAPTPAPQPLQPAAIHPDLREASRAEARGDYFYAQQLRRQVAEVDHQVRRARVEAQVARDQATFERLRDRFGEHVAERSMEDPR